MRTTISVSISAEEAKKTSQLASLRGFRTTSDYLRFLMAEDDAELITQDEVLWRSKKAREMHKKGKLPILHSIKDLTE
jgi:hypothetical protein